VKVEFWKELE